jgi:hypothetical protein
MTTEIITDLINPMCEFFYKFERTLDIYQANINTIRNYSLSSSDNINFGFEIFQPIEINAIKIQPGVLTTNGQFNVFPNISLSTTIDIQNSIVLSGLSTSSFSTVSYTDKTFPIVISIQAIGSTVVGIASNYATNGWPYSIDEAINANIVRQFESDYVNQNTFSALIFLTFKDVTINGISTQWTAQTTSIYNADINSYRYNNGFGQFFSYPANAAFIPNMTGVSTRNYSELYTSTYSMVYNWINHLSWSPDFTTWYSVNYELVPEFTRKFLHDYFSL